MASEYIKVTAKADIPAGKMRKVNAGEKEVFTDYDGWTVKTRDGFPSAHFEHTVVITENGAEILTV